MKPLHKCSHPSSLLFCFVLFCFVLFCFVLFCFVIGFILFCFVLFCLTFSLQRKMKPLHKCSHPSSLLFCFVLFCFVLSIFLSSERDETFRGVLSPTIPFVLFLFL